MTEERKKLGIGILGCGPISQFAHFDACRKARNAEIRAVCDVAEDLLAKASAVHGPFRTYREFARMLEDPAVEAVIIATADQFHVPLCIEAAAAGKHILVEKPLGVDVGECEELRKRVKASGIVFQVGNNRRFDPGIAFAGRFVREEIGELLSLKAWYCDSTYRYTMTDNLQPIPFRSDAARKPSGNPKADRKRYFVLTHASHLVDTARFLGGEILALRARHRERCGAHSWFIDLELANGALGHLDMTIPVRGDFEEGFQIQGEHGSVKGRVYLPWFHKSSDVECFSAKDVQFHRPLGEDAHTYKRQIEGFAASILDGAPRLGAGIDDGVAALRALVAIARSSETGEPVRLADVQGSV
jgi:predicted dehydrogenase